MYKFDADIFNKEKELNDFGKYGKLYKPDVLFIGDSTGTLLPEDIKKIYKALRIHWKGEIGIHAHDNMHRALTNTIEAYRNGSHGLIAPFKVWEEDQEIQRQKIWFLKQMI